MTDKQEVDGPTDSTESDTDTESDNSPPNARLSAEVSSENTGPVIRLDASDSSDPDGDELEYKWETVDGPYSEDRYPYDMTASSGPKTSVSGEISGKTFIFRVTVSDGEGSDTATTTVTVPEQPDESDDTPSLESTTTETETETEEPTTTAPPRSTTTATTGLPETSTSPTTAAPEAEWESFETDGCTSYSAGAYGGRQMYDASTDTTTVRYFVANSEEETLHITVRFNDGRDKNYTLASNANVTDSVKVKGRVDFPFIDSDCELVSTETSTTTDSISTSTTDTETPVTETETETPIKGAVDCSQFYVDTTNVTGFGPEGEGLYHIEGTVSHDSDRPLAVSFEVVMVDWNSEIVERHTVEKTLAPGETATWSVTADASYVEDSYKIGPAGQKDYECGWD